MLQSEKDAKWVILKDLVSVVRMVATAALSSRLSLQITFKAEESVVKNGLSSP